jgi:tetratricopeptide (TPR) repeat protein
MMNPRDYAALVSNCMLWHAKDEHLKIIEAIEALGEGDRDYGLLGFYARALNNTERYEEALDILYGCEEEGKEDGVWHFRTGYSLYYLNREEEAASHFRKAIDYGDDGEDTRAFLKASIEEAAAKKEEEAPEMYTESEMSALEAHIEKYFGPYENVFHELVSPDVHIDIAVIEPRAGHDYYTLVTMGMGAHRMNVPGDLGHLSRAEMMVCLPAYWNIGDLTDESWYWPLRWLKIMARLPIEQDTWLGWGHTVPAGGPFAPNTGLSVMMLLYPGAFPRQSFSCPMADGSDVHFYQMVPLYDDEAAFKIKNGAEALLEKLTDLEYVTPDRKNVC